MVVVVTAQVQPYHVRATIINNQVNKVTKSGEGKGGNVRTSIGRVLVCDVDMPG